MSWRLKREKDAMPLISGAKSREHATLCPNRVIVISLQSNTFRYSTSCLYGHESDAPNHPPNVPDRKETQTRTENSRLDRFDHQTDGVLRCRRHQGKDVLRESPAVSRVSLA